MLTDKSLEKPAKSMLDGIKAIARSTPVISEFYYLAKVLRDMPAKEWADFDRLNLFRKTYPNTMVGYARLSNAFELANKVEQSGTIGAFVECGVWKGGCIATMAWVAKQANSDRNIWLFDSFQGLPEPTDEDGPGAWAYVSDYAVREESARVLLTSRLGIKQENVHIVKGWFHDTLPGISLSVGPISILRLDGDFYDSTKCCLENLYDNVVDGGYVIIDDYGCWKGCRKATDEFIKDLSIDLEVIDSKGRFFQKR